MLTKEKLNAILQDTLSMARRPAEKPLHLIDGWGELERIRREAAGDDLMCPHLRFGEIGEEQAVWRSLIEHSTVGEHLPEDVPISYNLQEGWTELIEAAIAKNDRKNWYAYYLLGCAELARAQTKCAAEHLETSLSLCESPWAHYALAIAEKKLGRDDSAHMLAAYALRKDDISLAKALFKCLHEHEMSEKAVELFEDASADIRENARCRLYYAYALARLGEIARAEDIIRPNGGYLVVPDIRECELTITQLWVYIQEQKGLTRETMGEIPRDLDFRMFAKREGWK